MASLFLVTTILCIFSHLTPSISTVDHHPYQLLPSIFSTNYQKMLTTFKIFPYAPPPLPFNATATSSFSLFHSSLLSSTFVTRNPKKADLFYLQISPHLPPRRLDRHISRARSSFSFWNKSLGADHFFLSSCSRTAVASASSSSRNVVELRKNAVRVACFPSRAGFFIPHKDISLPPYSPHKRFSPTRSGKNYKYLGFFKNPDRHLETNELGFQLIERLRNYKDFKIDDEAAYVEDSRFCLFVYGGEEDVVGLSKALAYGCVPVVITNRPIHDMPLMDVLRWQEFALFVGPGVGPDGLKRMLNEVAKGESYERMKRLGVTAAQHFVWNNPPKPYDAFHMVVYQLWLRRHAVRYATSEMR